MNIRFSVPYRSVEIIKSGKTLDLNVTIEHFSQYTFPSFSIFIRPKGKRDIIERLEIHHHSQKMVSTGIYIYWVHIL